MRPCSSIVGASTMRCTHPRTPPSRNAQRAMRRACPEYPRVWKPVRNALALARQNWYALEYRKS